MKKPKFDLIVCACLSPMHQLIMSDYGINGELWISLRIPPKNSIWKRIAQAWNYVLGKDLEYAEVQVDPTSARQIKKRMETFLNE